MICIGEITRADISNEITMINSDGLEIYSGYRHNSAPEKLIIHGCDGTYTYLGELLKQNRKNIFAISKDDMEIVKIEQVPSLLIPKCKIRHIDRSLDVSFSVKSGKATIHLLEKDHEIASMSFMKNNYEVIIDDDEDPTLSASMLIGICEVNKLADRALSKV